MSSAIAPFSLYVSAYVEGKDVSSGKISMELLGKQLDAVQIQLSVTIPEQSSNLHILVRSLEQLMINLEIEAIKTSLDIRVLVEKCLATLEVCLRLLTGHRGHMTSDIFSANVLWKLLVIITTVVEHSRSLSDQVTSEALTEIAMKCLAKILLFWRLKLVRISETMATDEEPSSHKDWITRMKSLEGPAMAQLVMSCLTTAKHPSRSLSRAALSCLQEALDCMPHTYYWKVFLPGIFSGLHSICVSGYKRYIYCR
jgi:hypothetical protein